MCSVQEPRWKTDKSAIASFESTKTGVELGCISTDGAEEFERAKAVLLAESEASADSVVRVLRSAGLTSTVFILRPLDEADNDDDNATAKLLRLFNSWMLIPHVLCVDTTA
eukprot:TRINITY_DN5638_c0_g2_i3.p1 TRINITY_DN5638_c0_g2~~TRINITY_DN5638_c0_g2_i3.p1  ORF type:complete len:111 (+),score=4.90 TRINITY_DN5638_c0_g2_i3:478-810(+)